MRFWQRTFAMLMTLAALIDSPAAEKRVALVVGNDVYPNLPAREQLQNAINDARAVKSALESPRLRGPFRRESGS